MTVLAQAVTTTINPAWFAAAGAVATGLIAFAGYLATSRGKAFTAGLHAGQGQGEIARVRKDLNGHLVKAEPMMQEFQVLKGDVRTLSAQMVLLVEGQTKTNYQLGLILAAVLKRGGIE